jgi:probable FeS assembly SUF system protein SufT
MHESETVTLTRDCEAAIVPVGDKVTLQKGEQALITQSLGGTYTVVVNGNMFRIDSKNADALGKEVAAKPAGQAGHGPASPEDVEKEVWNLMRSVYDPEIPVNIVDLGLVYDCKVDPKEDPSGTYCVEVKMTLTAPGCGMGPVLQEDVHNKVLSIETVDEARVELVWDPPWNQGMMTEAAKLQLGMM